jgi:soluble calcium-activated nucleotidase 1
MTKILCLVVTLLNLILSPSLEISGAQDFERFGGATQRGYFSTEGAIISDTKFRFAAVTDLDQLSRITDSKKPLFKSVLLPGVIAYDKSTNQYSIEFDPPRTLTSYHNEAGRGMELSELTLYNNRLLAFDDRTGSVFEILNKNHGQDSFVVPRFVITEGSGDTDKGMKWEWATVKDGELWMGSMGKEYTNPDGSIANTNNLWISILSPRGELRRVNWVDKYNFVRAALGASAPGYLIHEAILWSSHLKKWVFVPRRISSEAYDENTDERKGSNKLCLVDEKFTTSKVVEIKMKEVDPLHGFSSIAFVPGSKDRHILALRSVEEDCVGGDESKCKQRSYFMIFDVLTGDVLLEETKYPTEMLKFEGVEFVDIYTPEPDSSI